MTEDAQMKIRLPRALKERIEASADENNRSWTGEIVARLERSFAEDVERTKQALDTIQASPIIRMEKKMIGVEAKLDARLDEHEQRLRDLENRLPKP